jgi:hypothetical protein
MNVRAWQLLGVLTGLALAGCGGYYPDRGVVGPMPSPSPVTLSATPSTYAFALDHNAPQLVNVTRSSGTFASLLLSVADPTIIGVTTPTLSGTSASFSIIPIAHGSTTVRLTDQTGAMTAVHVNTASCGRPASMLAAQQLVPASGATNVSSSIGTLYFLAYFQNGAALSGNLHVIAGNHRTLEGGPLVAATAPPGTIFPTPIPIPNTTDVVVSASVPALAPAQRYRTEVYNDTCQPAVLAGAFST